MAEGQAETTVKYPEIVVPMSGHDGNAVAIMMRVQRYLRRAGVPEEELTEFMSDATSGDYDHVLATVMAWVNVT